MTNFGFSIYWLIFFGAIVTRYFLIVGSIHVLCFSLLKRFLDSRCVGFKVPSWQSVRHDAELSVLSSVIFSFFAAFIMMAYNAGITRLYTHFRLEDLGYGIGSFVLVLLLQDTYFYFVHRLSHHPSLFKRLHWGHHRSGTPTPWTSFAFDPPEAIAQALFLVAIVFIIPLHVLTLIAVLSTMTAWSIFNHAGFRLLQSSKLTGWLGEWLIGASHHLLHHRNYKIHYGLYFTHWDKILGTHNPIK